MAINKLFIVAILLGTMSSQQGEAAGESALLTDWTKLRIAAQEKSHKHDDFAALENLRNALALADKLGPKSMYRAVSLRELAEFQIKGGKYDEALALLLEERSIVSGVPKGPMAIDNLAELVHVSVQLGDEKSALDYMADLERISDFKDDMVIGSAEHVASMYARLGRTKLEHEYRERTWKSVAKARGDVDPQTLVLKLKVADLSAKEGNLKDALVQYLEIVREAIGKQHSFNEMIKPAITGACTIYHTLHQDDKAELLYTEVLNSMRSSLSSAEKAYLFRRLFDTMVWYGTGAARLERAEKTVQKVSEQGRRENDRYLLAEGACERAALELQKQGPSPAVLRYVEAALRATKNIASFDSDRAWMLKLIKGRS
jgi:hypothetical protein